MNVYEKTRFDGKVARPRGVKASKNGTESPRTRPGQAFPGGKHMRKALKRLSMRQNAYKPTSSPSGHGQTKPGSMNIG